MFASISSNAYAKNYSLFFKQKVEDNLRKIDEKKIDKDELVAIYTVLQNTPELHMHQMNGEVDNTVYIHPVKGYEIVKDKNGNIIKEGPNMGTYNYYLYNKEPLHHFLYDIEPWIRWGSYEKDPTSLNQRIKFYLMDLRIGTEKFLNLNVDNKIKKDIEFDETEKKVLALFVTMEEEAKTSIFKKLLGSSNEGIEEDLDRLANQFGKIYGKDLN